MDVHLNVKEKPGKKIGPGFSLTIDQSLWRMQRAACTYFRRAIIGHTDKDSFGMVGAAGTCPVGAVIPRAE